jgi:hypothetical protein
VSARRCRWPPGPGSRHFPACRHPLALRVLLSGRLQCGAINGGISLNYVDRSGGLDVISTEDGNRLRSASAFRRAVWGLRLIALVPLFMLALVVLGPLGVAPASGTPVFAIAFVSTAVGVGLVWSSILPMEKVKKSVLPKYELDSVERSVLMNGLFLRAAFRPSRTR